MTLSGLQFTSNPVRPQQRPPRFSDEVVGDGEQRPGHTDADHPRG
jgi:hypothetical protein